MSMTAGAQVSQHRGASRSGSTGAPTSKRSPTTRRQKSSKLKVPALADVRQGGSGTPLQLPLLFGPASRPEGSANGASRTQAEHKQKQAEVLDQRMPTREVLRIVGVNRSTVFRWIRKGLFPQKHVAGGWLRSDVERWLSSKSRPPA
jgi:predicted DNA-binding transcriptional regulator AlpA